MLLVLAIFVSHLAAFALGVGIRSVTLRARQDQLDARDETLGLRELLVNGRADQVRRGVVLGTPTLEPSPGIGPATAVLAGRLRDATLAQAQAIFVAMKVQRERERAEFVEIMTKCWSVAR